MRQNFFIRISIGSDLFQTGDKKLIDHNVTLGEGESISSCNFTVRADTETVDRYFATIYKNNGLDPVTLPSPDKGNSGSNSGNSSSNFSGSIPSLNGVDAAKIKQAVNFYLGKGLSLEGAAYLVGNYIQESSLNPLADNGLGNLGFAQWDSGRRATNGGMPTGFNEQLNWALAEMLTDSTGSGINHNIREKLNGTDIEAIMRAISDWERYGGDETGGRYTYGAQLLEALRKGSVKKEDAKDSTVSAQNPIATKKDTSSITLPVATGSQITVESGFNGQILVAYSFLHTSINYDFNKKTLTFGGQAATWILTQRVKSTAYKDCTLKQIAEKICNAHGLKLKYKGEEIKYKYFPQLGITDYECLLLECRRIGYRLNCDGATLTIAPRLSRKSGKTIGTVEESSVEIADFVLEYGRNLSTFTVNHSAGSNSGGARSSSPSERESTGELKFELNPDSGKIEQVRKEDPTGAGVGNTGYHTATIKPLTEGSTDEADKTRRENELRIKGIVAEFTCPTDNDTLLLTPDSIFQTFNISNFLDRVWVVEKVSHQSGSSGNITTGTVYSPMKNKYPPVEKTDSTSKSGERTSLRNAGGFIDPTAGKSVRTSGYGQRNGRLHAGVDLASDVGTPIYCSKDGKVTDVENSCVLGDTSCGGGYGNLVYIDHGENFITRYAHMKQGSVTVSIGQFVKQGDQIGQMDNTGASRGSHLHFEIHKNGTPIDPESLINFR